MNKKILIFPASTYQLPFIEKAIEMGLYVITLDNVPNNPGHVIAHKSYNISTTNDKEIIEVCKYEHVDAVLSPCSDVSLIALSKVGEALNLISPNTLCTKTLTSKINFRTFQCNQGIPHPEFQALSSYDEGIKLSFPFIMKPDVSLGSKGVFIVEDKSEFCSRYVETRTYSLSKKIVIEKEIHGHHLTVEGIMRNGKLHKMFVSDRITAPNPYTATWGHIMPSIYSNNEEIISRITLQIEKIFMNLNYTDGIFDSDIVFDNSGEVYIIELTPRVGGNSLVRLIKAAYGFDIVDYALKQALGINELIKFTKPDSFFKLKLLGSMYESVMRYELDEIECLKQHPDILHIQLDYPSGSIVQPFINGRNRAGEVLFRASSIVELENMENSLINSVVKFQSK